MRYKEIRGRYFSDEVRANLSSRPALVAIQNLAREDGTTVTVKAHGGKLNRALGLRRQGIAYGRG